MTLEQENDYIVILATHKETKKKVPQVYVRSFYKDSWLATIIQNTFGAFDNECEFEEFSLLLGHNIEDKDVLFSYKS